MARLSVQKQKSKRPTYLALVLLLAAIIVAACFGRSIERRYPFLIYLIPYSVFVLFLFHATIIARRLAKKSKDYFLMAGLVAAPFLCTLLSGLLVELPIERIHVVKYGLLGFALTLFFEPRFGKRRFWLGFLLGCIIGVAEETAQFWIPDRRFDTRDILLNVCCVGFGIFYAWLVSLADNESGKKGSGDAAVDDLK